MPSTRHTDPETSHLAEASVNGVREKQQVVYEVLAEFGPLTDEQLVNLYEELHEQYPDTFPQQSTSGLRTRRSELVDLEMVAWTGEKVRSSSNRLRRTWVAISEDSR